MTAPERFKIACCARRAGKSYAVAAYLIIECLRSSNTPCLYLGLTRDSAKEAVWGTLLMMLEQHDIPHEARPSSLQIRFPNGSTITLFGGDVPNARNRLRGRKFKLVAADETGFFLDLDPLMFAILPTLADMRGTLVMASSPGERLAGFFYDAYMGSSASSWRQWHWTMRDNPHFMGQSSDPKRWLSAADEELDTICRLQFGGNERHPAFEREYLGKYVRDDTALIYPYSKRNLIDLPYDMPRQQHALGIDLGVASASAIAVLRYSPYSRDVQIVKTWSKSRVLIDELAEIVENFRQEYDPSVIVADTGGLGAAFVQEFRRRYHLPIKPAEKMDKTAYQRIFSNDLISGYIKVLKDLKILTEWDSIIRDKDGDEQRGQENHEADAALYVYRYVYNLHLKTFAPVETPEQIMERQLEQSARLEAAEERDEAIYDF